MKLKKICKNATYLAVWGTPLGIYHAVPHTYVTNIPSDSSLHTSSNGDLSQPRTERRTGDCAFSVTTPRAWNHLPTELKLMRSSTATFRRHLKSFLFRTAYWLSNAPSGWLKEARYKFCSYCYWYKADVKSWLTCNAAHALYQVMQGHSGHLKWQPRVRHV